MPHKTHACGPTPKARYPHLPNDRTTMRQKGYDFQRWATYTDGGTRAVDGETQAGRGAVARSPLSPPRLIALSQVPELTPITPLK